ncbi:hypothetical protein DFS34DRAFT_617107 [Phlyctochytrium arcticum]|nr:hypothetical protein DFS34DRAFT_617107 [Phlyctochytrium arcticum]
MGTNGLGGASGFGCAAGEPGGVAHINNSPPLANRSLSLSCNFFFPIITPFIAQTNPSTNNMSGIVNRATDTASAVAAKVDPYVPQVAKNAANFAIGTASATANFALGTAVGAKDRAVNAATGTVNFASNTVNAATGFASDKVHGAIDLGKVVVNGATTTITAYTPNPILNLVTSTVDGARSLQSDPVGTVKGYVPTFVINAGEKSYEIVHNTKERTVNGVSATTGFIVTKVNGAVHAVTSVPQIHNLIEQLNRLTAPVLNRLGVSKPAAPAAEIKSDLKDAATTAAAVVEENKENAKTTVKAAKAKTNGRVAAATH